MSKFRVYDKQEKKYADNQQHFYIDSDGNLFFDKNKMEIHEDLSLCDPYRYVVEFSTDAFEFDENRKQGKEMFQGDVVRCDCFESHEIYIVEIDNFKKLPDEMTGSKCNSRQIIGNIHGDENGKDK